MPNGSKALCRAKESQLSLTHDFAISLLFPVRYKYMKSALARMAAEIDRNRHLFGSSRCDARSAAPRGQRNIKVGCKISAWAFGLVDLLGAASRMKQLQICGRAITPQGSEADSVL